MSQSEFKSEIVFELAEEFIHRYRKGERPPLREYIERHPDLAAEIKEVFPAMAMMENIAVADDSLDIPSQKSGGKTSTRQTLQQLGDYRIIREIGHGGMGLVYEAEQVSLGRHVALKVLPDKALLDPKHKRRFEREAKAAAKLHHTNIVPVFGVGEHDGLPYYVMQFIQGLGLDTVLEEMQRMQPGATPTPSDLPTSGEMNLARRDISAALVARSLMTGEFEPPAGDGPARPAHPRSAILATGDEPAESGAGVGSLASKEASRLPSHHSSLSTPTDRSSDSLTASSSSITVPGQVGSGSKAATRKQNYWQSVAHIGRQVADALDYAHKQGVLHRDIKPSNLLLDLRGTVWVTDFGLAKVSGPGAEGDNLTHTGDILGTLRYMPPEAFNGRSDARGDVYSLGLTLYETLTLRPAYADKDRHKLIKQVTTGEPAALDKVNPQIPRDLVTIVHKAIDRDPGRRYATPGDFASDLQRFLDDEPILARRQTQLERYMRWARHNPGIAVLGAILTAVLLLATITSLLVANHMTDLARAEARSAADERRARQEAVDSQKREADQRIKAEAAEETGRKLLYTTDMRLAPFVWRDDRTTAEQLRVLLAKHIPNEKMKDEGGRMNAAEALGADLPTPPTAPLKPDLRGFEWYYYQHLLESGAAIFSEHGVSVIDDAFTSNGQLVTLDQNGQVRRWDLGSQNEDEASRRDLPGGPGAQVRVLSPNGRLAALAEGNRVHVFDTSTGKETFQIDSAKNRFRRLLFSRDSDRLVIVDDKIRWASAVSGEVIASLDQKFDHMNSLALSGDGLTLANVGHGPWGGRFSIFRLDPTAKTVIGLAKDPGSGGTKVASALSPDGKQMAVSFFNGMMGVFDTTTGRRIAANGSAHPAVISAMAFSGDGAKLATADAEGTIKIWADAHNLTSESTALRTLKGHQGSIKTLGFSSDGKWLVTTGVDKTARVWDLENSDVAIRRLDGFRGALNFVVRFSPDGQLIAGPAGPGSGWASRGVHLWDPITGRLVRQLKVDNESDVFSVAFSPTDCRLLAVGHGEPTPFVSLWDIDAGTELARLPTVTDLPYIRQARDVGTLTFSPDGKYLVAGSGAKHYTTRKSTPSPLMVWEVATRRLVHILHGHMGYCISLDFSRDGSLLASGSRDGTAILWSTKTWKATRTLQNPDRAEEFDDEPPDQQAGPMFVEDVAFSPDGKTLAMASYSGSVQLWDVSTGKLLDTLKGHSSAVRAVVFSPDGRTLASASSDQTVRLWNVQTRRELMQLDPGSMKLGNVQTLAFSPDGRQLVAAGRNAAVWSTAPRVWNDSDKAAEKLHYRLQSSTDFQIRIRMLSENARLQGTLEKLEKLAPDDVRVQAAQAVTEARRFAAKGNAPLADAARAQARGLFEGMLAKQPENSVLAVELAQLLLAKQENLKATGWTVLKPLKAKSKLGATLSILPDDSILASGANPLKDRYRLVLTVGKNIDLAAVRLEALTHPSLPEMGPGRSPRGSFAQTSWNVTAASPDRKDPITLQFDNAWANPHTPGFPITPNGHWNISQGGEGRNCTAVWSMSKPVSLTAGTKLTFEMQFKESNDLRENLGCFRLSVSSDPAALGRERKRFAVWSFADPWQQLAAAYHILGEKQAFDNVLKRHPSAAAVIGDLYAEHQDWERAIAEYRKLLTDQPADATLLSKLAAAYESVGRTREAVPYLAKMAAANPQETLLSIKVAALQVWFAQEKEFAATCQRLLALAKNTDDVFMAARAAYSCCIAASTDKAELEAALALSRTAVKVEASEWPLLLLGMAQYRSGNDTAADEALRAVAEADPQDPRVPSIAAFYRAMSLFRQGRLDEARGLATAAAAKMKPLPKDAQNPLVGEADRDDLIMWLAYKEAKELIRFDSATPPNAQNDKR
jgi:WD40 repeat protein/serine/threonine protein kinase/tetratricopeptide (TPR) repeat protein